jgi:hypothetical protein
VTRLSEEQRAKLLAEEERRLSAEEFNARASVPMSEREREDFDDLVRWFTIRYPTAGDRMRYVRQRMQAMRRRVAWTRSAGST